MCIHRLLWERDCAIHANIGSLVFTYHTLYDQYVHYVPVAQDLAKEVVVKYSNDFCDHCHHIIVPSTEVEQILKGHIRTPITVLPTEFPCICCNR